MLQSIRPALLLVFTLLLPACGAFNFHGQDIALQHNVEQDTLELELVYRNVETPKSISTPPGSKTSGEAYTVETIQKIAQGKRYFMLCIYGVAFDLDLFEQKLHEESVSQKNSGTVPNLAARGLALCESISIPEAQVFVDKNKRLGIRQVIRMTDAKRALETLNLAWHQDVIRTSENGKFERDTADYFDAATREKFLSEAKSGVQWIRWSGSDLRISLPVNASSSSRLLRALLKEMEGEGKREIREAYSVLFGTITEISSEDGRLTMICGADREGIIRMELNGHKLDYKDALLQRLRGVGFEFSPDPTAR